MDFPQVETEKARQDRRAVRLLAGGERCGGFFMRSPVPRDQAMRGYPPCKLRNEENKNEITN